MPKYLNTNVRSLHNETFNIWSHLIPGFCLALILIGTVLCKQLRIDVSLYLSRYTDVSLYRSATSVDAAVMLVFLSGAVFMFCASWSFHTMSNHSPAVHKNWNKLDYVGIIAMM